MPSKDTLSLAPAANSKLNALAAMIGPSIDAGYAFTKIAGTTADASAATIALTKK